MASEGNKTMTFTPIPITPLPSGEAVPILGQGTWGMGEDPRKRKAEAAALRFGIDLGMTLIDTVEMHGEGGAEEIVADAISGHRDEVFVVSKLYPHQATH
jgi:diketogulonate reductase-like aldo/keto reductase